MVRLGCTCFFKMARGDLDMSPSPLLIFGCITIYCFCFPSSVFHEVTRS